MKPSRKLQEEMTPREGVSSDEIKPFMCGLMKAGRGANALYNYTAILIYIKEKKQTQTWLEHSQILKTVIWQ